MATQTAVFPNNVRVFPQERESCKVAILGFGNVGRSVARILEQQCIPGLELVQVFNRNVERKRSSWTNSSFEWTEEFDGVLNGDADVVVEVVGGVEPARAWVAALLQAGKSVVTANKQLIARYGPELLEIAANNGCHLLFGASVAGGVPVITALQHGLAGDDIRSICGILNGTCNYIFNQMEQGTPFDAALKQAQQLGYAEADPTDDVEGYDTRAKLVILARVALRTEISLDQISCASTASVAPVDFEYAHELGCTIRQIGQAEVDGESSFATVQPMLVRRDSPLARARGCENVVITEGRFGGSNAFSGPGAGGDATAVAVLSDLLSLRQGAQPLIVGKSRQLRVANDHFAPYYLRFVVNDRPGIVAGIAAILAKYEINVDAVFQKPGYDKARLPFVVTVEACASARLDHALQEISHLEFLVEAPLKLRIFAH